MDQKKTFAFHYCLQQAQNQWHRQICPHPTPHSSDFPFSPHQSRAVLLPGHPSLGGNLVFSWKIVLWFHRHHCPFPSRHPLIDQCDLRKKALWRKKVSGDHPGPCGADSAEGGAACPPPKYRPACCCCEDGARALDFVHLIRHEPLPSFHHRHGAAPGGEVQVLVRGRDCCSSCGLSPAHASRARLSSDRCRLGGISHP